MSDFSGGAGSPFDRPFQRHEGKSIWKERPVSQQLYGSPSVSSAASAHSTPSSSLYLPLSSSSSASSSLSQQPVGGARQPLRSRARAGTLPSRLSPALVGRPGSTASLGSLALLSPSPSPVGSPTSQSPRYEFPQQTAFPGPMLTPGSAPQPAAAPPAQPHATQVQPPTAPSSVSRLRSGSLNVLDRPAFAPFGSSIWGNPESSSQQPQQPQPLPSQQQHPSHQPVQQQQQQQHSQELHGIAESDDPMKPFLSEMSARPDVSRLRSYTVNTLPFSLDLDDDKDSYTQYMQHSQQRDAMAPYAQQQMLGAGIPGSVPPHLHQLMSPNRPRAQTVSSPFEQQQQQLRYSKPMSQDLGKDQQYGMPMPKSSSPEDTSVTPTRSLWLGGLPSAVTEYGLQSLFASYGQVEAVRVLGHKQCGFVTFASVEQAVQARSLLNGQELFTGAGPARIGFAKVLDHQRSHSGSPEPDGLADATYDHPASSPAPLLNQAGLPEQVFATTVDEPRRLDEVYLDIEAIVANLGAGAEEQIQSQATLARARAFTDFKPKILPVSEPSANPAYDAPMLREVRKKIDSGACSQQEIDEIALDLLDEVVELSSDYVGNTVVQKLFDGCSEEVKDMMLTRIAPHLAEIGVHKNGTWAAQKIIGVANTHRQINMICEALRPYTVQLFLDQYGNYVIQCCLKFGSPWSDFIFESVLQQFWPIAQGRFGARAMRACLESQHTSRQLQRLLAAAVAVHAVQLATNANGALLLTWLLDTCVLPNRHAILAPLIIPNLVALCTHKLASLTVLKIINHKAEPGARETVFEALFNVHDEAAVARLRQIAADPQHGATFLYKVVSSPLLEVGERHVAAAQIRLVLLAIRASPSQGYKRLMDEVGLSRQGGGSGPVLVSGNGMQSPSQPLPMKHRRPQGSSGRPMGTIGQPSQFGPGMPMYSEPQGPVAYAADANYGPAYGLPQPAMPVGDVNYAQQQFEQMSLGPSGQQYHYPSRDPDYFSTGYMNPPGSQMMGYASFPVYDHSDIRRE